MLSTFGAASSRAFGLSSGGPLRFTSSQSFKYLHNSATGTGFPLTYTPTAGTKAALFMVFGGLGVRTNTAIASWFSGGGGGAYAERYVEGLDASYVVGLPRFGGNSTVAGISVYASPSNSVTGASINTSTSTHDFAAAGGNGGNGIDTTAPSYGYGGGGGGRCGNGGQGAGYNFNGYDSSGGAPLPNSGNEAAGVFDLSPFGITFTYDRYSSQVPKFDAASTAAEIALKDDCNYAVSHASHNGGYRGETGASSDAGTVIIIEFS